MLLINNPKEAYIVGIAVTITEGNEWEEIMKNVRCAIHVSIIHHH